MTLPPAFELAGLSDELALSSSLHLTWAADDTPMRWDVSYSCTEISGVATGGPIDERAGALTIDGAELVDLIGEPNVADGSCIATIDVLRIREGSLDKAFPATLATGIQSRSFDVHLVP